MIEDLIRHTSLVDDEPEERERLGFRIFERGHGGGS
jgi:hypothetical protein